MLTHSALALAIPRLNGVAGDCFPSMRFSQRTCTEWCGAREEASTSGEMLCATTVTEAESPLPSRTDATALSSGRSFEWQAITTSTGFEVNCSLPSLKKRSTCQVVSPNFSTARVYTSPYWSRRFSSENRSLAYVWMRSRLQVCGSSTNCSTASASALEPRDVT